MLFFLAEATFLTTLERAVTHTPPPALLNSSYTRGGKATLLQEVAAVWVLSLSFFTTDLGALRNFRDCELPIPYLRSYCGHVVDSRGETKGLRHV